LPDLMEIVERKGLGDPDTSAISSWRRFPWD
jgi:S-adenosylmethionine synthetase